MAWFDAADVVAEAGNPTPTTLGFADATMMNNHITNFLIPAAQSLIEQYLRRTYTDAGVPAGVRHAALRVVAVALAKIGIRKMGSLVRVQEWTVELSSPAIFTQEIRAELAPFEKRTPHTKASAYKSDDIRNLWGE